MLITKHKTGDLEQFHQQMEKFWSIGFVILYDCLGYPTIMMLDK
nr:MAG TPA: hypothetical protein [Caudoviricetes sp.]